MLLDESAADGPLDLPQLFGNTRPVEVEVGTGKGTFLLARARSRPELNFLGLERARAYCNYTADRCRRAGVANVRMIRADAPDFFRVCLSDSSLWRVHIYFPDPWPKRRHGRRRVMQPAFATQLARTLRAGGQLLIATDHICYFRQIMAVLNVTPGLARVPFPAVPSTNNQVIGSNFERKYIAQGRAFYTIAGLRYR
ncbi:MAG: tRNA (guanosine(46)-N7)-methyltransferase TrmB [Planctomycetota bacterium]